MKTKKARPLRKVKSLSAKTVSARQAKAVKGGRKGGYIPHLPSGPGG